MTLPFEFVLGSQSPRRVELLNQAGYTFRVVPPDEAAEGSPSPGETAEQLVLRLAKAKAANVRGKVLTGLVIGCDTVAEIEGKILGKPIDRADALRMLTMLQGSIHRVWSGLCLWPEQGEPLARTAMTALQMHPLTTREIERYLDLNLWQGKAGGFGYQDGNDWLRVISGSESNVVGLPLELLREMLSLV